MTPEKKVFTIGREYVANTAGHWTSGPKHRKKLEHYCISCAAVCTLVMGVYGRQLFLHKLRKMGICVCTGQEGNHLIIVCRVIHVEFPFC